MDSYSPIPRPELFFLADSHFRDRRIPGEADRRRRFIEFLTRIGNDSAVFLLGDIFDFYFEYATFVSKRYFDIYHALYSATRRGVEIHFLAGNHDAWYTNFLSDDLGITPHGNDLFVESQGRKIWCTHGDLFMPDDNNYKTIRSIIRNPLVIKASKIIHPDLMDAIAARVSNESKHRNRRSVEHMAKTIVAKINGDFFAKGNDIFVMGHVHYPLHKSTNGKDIMIVGDWIRNFTFGRLKGGRLSLEKFTLEETD
ncbi:MAG: UDP-2,3-diacylglucosamine diphosphatase [Candidatus Latescibacterota bacterium]|nr:MAG: UDP-2,3-diacylglucosamine diphosphatase [Candidatus Latescibacterota bacterium]